MISKYEKTNGVKLFALVAVLAMVFAGAAVMFDDSVDAAGELNLSGTINGTEQTFGDGAVGVMNGNLLVEEYPLAERLLRPDGADHWLLTTEVAGFAGVARFVCGLLDDIEIIDSPDLKRYIADYLRRNADMLR